MEQEIIETYKQHLTNPSDIYKRLKTLGRKYTLKQVKDVIYNIDVKQIYGKKQDNKDLEIPISAPPGSFQADLTFYEQFKKQNKGYSILLTIIEINTRYAYVYPLKNKTANSILECLQDLHKKEQSNLISISFDAGTEFNNNKVNDFLTKNNIKVLAFNKNESPNATSLIERFNRTIRDKISKYQILHKTKQFIDALPELVASYNDTIHTSINMSPNDAKKQKQNDYNADINKMDVLEKITEEFQIGDIVRIFKKKKVFQKGSKTFTKNVYQIIDKEGNQFILQKFKDGKLIGEKIKRSASQLQKVEFEKLIVQEKKNNEEIHNKEIHNKEIPKKQVKKEANLIKKLKREGLDQANIITNETKPNNDKPKPESSALKMAAAENIFRKNKEKKLEDEKKKIQQENYGLGIANQKLDRENVILDHDKKVNERKINEAWQREKKLQKEQLGRSSLWQKYKKERQFEGYEFTDSDNEFTDSDSEEEPVQEEKKQNSDKDDLDKKINDLIIQQNDLANSINKIVDEIKNESNKEKKQKLNQEYNSQNKKYEDLEEQIKQLKKQEISVSKKKSIKKQEISVSKKKSIKKQEISVSKKKSIKKQEISASKKKSPKKQEISDELEIDQQADKKIKEEKQQITQNIAKLEEQIKINSDAISHDIDPDNPSQDLSVEKQLKLQQKNAQIRSEIMSLEAQIAKLTNKKQKIPKIQTGEKIKDFNPDEEPYKFDNMFKSIGKPKK